MMEQPKIQLQVDLYIVYVLFLCQIFISENFERYNDSSSRSSLTNSPQSLSPTLVIQNLCSELLISLNFTFASTFKPRQGRMFSKLFVSTTPDWIARVSCSLKSSQCGELGRTPWYFFLSNMLTWSLKPDFLLMVE